MACTGGAAGACDAIVLPAVQRMRDRAFYLRNSSCDAGTPPFLLMVVLNSSEVTPLQHGIEESYTLTIAVAVDAAPRPETRATLVAANQWGALHGLSTLGQLIAVSADYSHYELSTGQLPLHIEDGPRVAWRSLLLDSGRHFLSPAILKRVVDTMAASHLNVLHWHAVDDASFPLCLDDALPGACEGQGYRDPWGTPLKYDKAWLREFVEYATARGVRIMVELDLPAHSMGLWRARPEVFVGLGRKIVALCYRSSILYHIH
jgi:hexosaminidase